MLPFNTVLKASVNAVPRKIKKRDTRQKSHGKEETKPSLFTYNYLENIKELETIITHTFQWI